MKRLPDLVCNNRIIAKVLEAEEEQIGSIVIPKTANAELTTAIVLKVDPTIEKHIRVGDTVIFESGRGQGQLIEGEPHVWIQFSEIWGAFSNPLSVAKDE